MFEGDYCPNCDNYIKELESKLKEAERVASIRTGFLFKRLERLEKAIQHCDPLCPAWTTLEARVDEG